MTGLPTPPARRDCVDWTRAEVQTLLAVARGDRVHWQAALDGDSLLAMAEAEGMVGLLAGRLDLPTVPSDFRRRLLARIVATETRVEVMLAELGRIVAMFREHEVRLLVLKGAVSSQRLYGDHRRRSFTDLDLLVDGDDAERGESLLRELGYRAAEPISPSSRGRHRKFQYESAFVHDEKQMLVDYHWRLAGVQFPMRRSFSDLWERRRSIAVGGFDFPTPGDTDFVVTTADHAAKHLWSKLEFLAQIAALPGLPVDWTEVERCAVAAGAARRVGLSFLLAHELLGAPLPSLPACLALARPRLASVRAIVERSLFSTTTRRTDAAGRDHLLLLDRRRDVLRSLAAALFVPTDADRHDAQPEAIRWLLRPIKLLLKRTRAKTPAAMQ